MGTLRKQAFVVRGMSCAACVARVEQGVQRLPGVERAQVSLLQARMLVHYREVEADSGSIIRAVKGLGYEAELMTDAQAAPPTPPADTLRRRFGTSLALLIPLVLLHHAGLGMPWDALQLLLLLPILYINRMFFVRGLRTLIQWAPNMDSLVAIGAVAAVADGVCNLLWAHRGTLYFESAGMILTIITLGKWLEARATAKTGAALDKLKDLLPATATVQRGQDTAHIPAEEVQIDDIVLIAPGESIPVDGVVIGGQSTVNEAALTGESLPAEKTEGAAVYAASINGHGLLRVRATKRRSESAMADIIRLVGEAAATKAPIARTADKVAGVFVPIVMGIALLATVVWLLLGYGGTFAANCGMAVLIISCPCALGLATPVAIMVGMGKGAEHGILYRNAEALERAKSISCLAFDKTGTLTRGEPTVCDILSATGHTREELLQLAACAENGSAHPLAAAIRAICPPGEAPESARYLPGLGVLATQNGVELLAGNETLLQQKHVAYDAALLRRLAKEGKTPLCFARQGEWIGTIAVQDPLRPEAPAAVSQLQQLGIRLCMMTGDHAHTAAAIANSLRINDHQAECLPADKENILRQLKNEGEIIGMVGDGINDAPALARADIGIALGGGMDIAKDSADIILVHNRLDDIAGAVQLSRAVIRNIRQNLFWAFAYNALAIPLAAGVFYPLCGWLLHPAAAAAAMGASSLCVVSNALRLRRFHFTPTESPAMTTINLSVSGMMCPHCENHVNKAVLSIPGVATCTASHKDNAVTITLDSPAADIQAIKNAITEAGYHVA